MNNYKGRRQNVSKEAFDSRLNEVKKNLPRFYTTIIKHHHPGINTTKLRNVVNHNIQNWEYLGMLEKSFLSGKNLAEKDKSSE